MAGEKTLAKPLSGAEIVEGIVSKIRTQLTRDCFLAPHIAYASYSFQAEIRVQFQNTGTSIKDTIVRANDAGGEVTNAEMESADVNVSDVPKPPNQERLETGQGVPTLVTSPTGHTTEKSVKYAKPETANAPRTTTRKAMTQGSKK